MQNYENIYFLNVYYYSKLKTKRSFLLIFLLNNGLNLWNYTVENKIRQTDSKLLKVDYFNRIGVEKNCKSTNVLLTWIYKWKLFLLNFLNYGVYIIVFSLAIKLKL